jgi:hypothetical protein
MRLTMQQLLARAGIDDRVRESLQRVAQKIPVWIKKLWRHLGVADQPLGLGWVCSSDLAPLGAVVLV